MYKFVIKNKNMIVNLKVNTALKRNCFCSFTSAWSDGAWVAGHDSQHYRSSLL